MNIAELFVSLGLKGADKTVSGLSSIKKELGGIKDISFETKAAIAAAMYGLERLMAASGKTGTGLVNFNALTGLSTKQLQQWQYAAAQAGAGAEDMSSSVKAVQSAMTNMLLGKGAPEGMGMLARTVGFDPARIKDTFYVLEKIQEFVRKAPPELAMSVAKSFGVADSIVAGMRRNMFRDDIFKKAPMYSEGELKQLDRVNIAWGNIGRKIEMAIGHLNAKHGGVMVQDISKLIDKLTILLGKFLQLAEQLKLFEKLSTVMGALADSVGVVSNAVIIANAPDTEKGQADTGKAKLNIMLSVADLASFLQHSTPLGKITPSSLMIDPKVLLKAHEAMKDSSKQSRTPQSTTVNVNQTFMDNNGKDHQKTSDATTKGVKQAYRQLSAQAQGT